jgi:hypothetical protein
MESQAMFLECPAYLDRRHHKMWASRRSGSAVHHEIHRRAPGKRQDQVPTRSLVQRAHRVPHNAGEASRGGEARGLDRDITRKKGDLRLT